MSRSERKSHRGVPGISPSVAAQEENARVYAAYNARTARGKRKAKSKARYEDRGRLMGKR